MKRKITGIILLIVLCLIAVGCKKKEEEKVVGGWTIDLASQSLVIPKEAGEAFNKAMEKEQNPQLEPIALLGTQVVAGTNYMFFCSYTPKDSTEDSSYKVVIIYKDLQGGATLSKTKDFNVNQYAGEDIEGDTEMLTGGWTINTDMQDAKIKEEVMNAFEKATENIKDVTYTPIVVLGKQVVAGMNYAVLTLKTDTTGNASINVLTIYRDLEDNAELTASAYVNLADYNK